RLGFEEDAEWVEKEARSYKADVRRVLDRSIFTTQDGAVMLPLFPETRELLRASRWLASNYYCLCVGTLLEAGGDIVTLDSKYADLIIDAMENRGGLLMGMARFWGGVDHAYTSGYWYDRLMKGEPEKVLLGLYGSLAYGMSRGTYSAV